MKPFVLFLFLVLYHVRGQMHGGNIAEQGKFPYIVQIYNMNAKEKATCVCGGAIIHVNWVVTAAHCVRDRINKRNYNISIVVGDVMREKRKKKVRLPGESENRQYYHNAHVIPHRLYDHRNLYRRYDIALLYFKDPIDFSSNDVDFIRLPNPEKNIFDIDVPLVEDKCTAMGWGCTEVGTNSPSSQLKYAELRVQKVDTNYITLAVGEHGTQPLSGDSGSPLVCKNNAHKMGKQQEDILCGVLARGSDNKDNTYIKLGHNHLNWIAEKRREKEMLEKHKQANYVAVVTGLTGLAGILFAYRRG